MVEIFELFEPISLDEMSGIRLMNRIDSKYLIPIDILPCILMEARNLSYIQQINNLKVSRYETLYMDTPKAEMYLAHHNGKQNRQKIRIRRYADNNAVFFEIKNKNNRKRTSKKRIPVNDIYFFENETDEQRTFMEGHTSYNLASLIPYLMVYYKRITLVNKEKTERLTIDFDLSYLNKVTHAEVSLPKMAIIEVKRDGNSFSPMIQLLNQKRIAAQSISKYCLGMVATDPSLKRNRLKKKLLYLKKLTNTNYEFI